MIQSQDNKKNIENFGLVDLRDTCHFSCSSINIMNMLLFIIIIIMLYQLLK
jgi:hypothetical protein